MGITTKIHAVCISEKLTLKFQLSARNRHNAPEVPKLIESLNCKTERYLFVGRAYENNKALALALR